MVAKSLTAADGQVFPGFPTTALAFLEELRIHNDRDWFAARKGRYDAELKRPMQVLVQNVSDRCRHNGFGLFPKKPSSVTRIYRDTRFFPEKGPFHHFVGGMLGGKSSIGEMYVHLSPEGCFTAAGIYMPPAPFLKALREKIASRPEAITGLVKELARKKLNLVDEWKLKRMPRGFESFSSSNVAEYLKLNCFIVGRALERDEIQSPDLVGKLVKFALDSKPLLEWGWSFREQVRRQTALDFLG